MGPGGFFPTDPDLADILGRTDLDFETSYFLDLLDPNILDCPQISKFLYIQVGKSFSPFGKSYSTLTIRWPSGA